MGLQRSVRFRLGLGALLCGLFILPLDTTAKRPLRLATLPDTAHSLIIYRHLTRIISLSQVELITEEKKKKHTNETLNTLNKYLKASANALKIMSSNTSSSPSKSTPFPSFDQKVVLDFLLADPQEQARWIKNAENKMLATVCTQYPAIVTERDEHNFFVFYMHNIQNLCGTKLVWQPKQKLASHSFIKIFFEKGLAVPHAHLFSRAHRYLESPVHKPFLLGGYRRGIEDKLSRIYLAFYFQYSELALDARHISLANREFFVRRTDLRGVIKGFSLTQKLFAALTARGLVG